MVYSNGDHSLQARMEPPSGHPLPAVAPLEAGCFQDKADRAVCQTARSAEVGKGDTFGHLLERLGFSSAQAHEVAAAAGELLDLTKVRPGNRLTVYRDKNTNAVLRLRYESRLNPPLIMVKTPLGYAVSWQEFEPIKCLDAAEGEINASLWESAVGRYGLDPELVMSMADIFAYDIDFFTDIQKGDKFALLFEQQFSRGESKGAGRILAARFVNDGRELQAYYYEDEEGNGGYYDEKGRSLKKMFLKSPLQYRRISSYFSKSRLHPILKIRRPHLGVDYSAPTGTPVEALGDGKLEFVGKKGGYGNFIVIKHSRNYTTMYGHLNGFAKGIKKGDRVKQGQLIGYVGSTGLSTGPHLDFRVKEGKDFIDPLSVKLAPAPPIKESERQKFLEVAAQRRMEMSQVMASK